MNDIANGLCQLLGRFADPTHPALKGKPFSDAELHTGSGVAIHERGNVWKFMFMVTINGTSKLLTVDFNADELSQEYVKATVIQVVRTIDRFSQAQLTGEDGLITLH